MSDIWRWLNKRLLEEDGIEAIFAHIRNLVVATVVIAAGASAIRQGSNREVFGVLNLALTGFTVEAIGFALVALNFIDGLRKLTRLGSSLVLRIALVGLYVLISMRLIQLIVLLRGG
jgi:hypothetical protein